MQKYFQITDVYGREILDSRGNPTVEVEITVDDEVTEVASVPSGASTGQHEAVELRDNEVRYRGKGVLKAVCNVTHCLSEDLIGCNVIRQRMLDQILLNQDGTKNKEKMGANAILGVSLAAARVAAKQCDLPLYRYLGGVNAHLLPTPMMNILNGGCHSKNSIDFQEFMIMPIAAATFQEGLRMGTEIYHELKDLLDQEGHSTAVGDEGGFAPDLSDADEVFSYLMRAVKQAGYEPGKDVVFAMDAAASELYNQESALYNFPGEAKIKYRKKSTEQVEEYNGRIPDTEQMIVSRSTDEMIDYYEQLCERYPLRSIEDGLDENDWEGWQKLTLRLGERVQLVGDDLFVTNPVRLAEGIEKGAANAILIKVNQIGTLTEAIEAIELARKNGYHCVISHRSGETEDTTIADLAVAMNAGQIKTGAPCRSERVAKYNRLLRIEDELGEEASYHNPFV